MEPRLLLTALCLGLWTGTGTGSGTADRHERVTVMEDQDALLPCSFDTPNPNFDWKKEASGDSLSVFMSIYRMHYNKIGGGVWGQDELFQRRVKWFEDQLQAGNASIVIRKVSPVDSGNYTCNPTTYRSKRRARVELIVEWILKPRDVPGAARKPSTSLKRAPDGFLLQCSVEGASPQPTVVWWDSDGQVVPAEEPKVTQYDGRYDVYLQAKVTKSGFYRCVAKQLQLYNQVYTETFVPNPAVKPYITNLKESPSEALLQCEVLGVSPQTSLVVKDDAGNEFPVKEREETGGAGGAGGGGGGGSDIIVRASVTADGFYHCEATQEGGRPHVSEKTHVKLPESSSGATVPAWLAWVTVIGGVVGGLLLGVALHFYIDYRCKKQSSPPPEVI